MYLPWIRPAVVKAGTKKPSALFLASLSLLGTAASSSLAFATYSQQQFEQVINEDEAQLDRVRDQEINQLKLVLGRRFAANRKPDILLRLGELYTEKYRFYFLKEGEIHQKRIKQGIRKIYLDNGRSRAYLNSAANSCLAILHSRVPFAKMDQVYYLLGFNYSELHKKRDAEKYYKMLVGKYPQSAYSSEAYRELGEYAFEDKKYSASLAYYQRAARFTNVPSYPRTLYKLAWAYFKMRRRNEGLETLKKVIQLVRSDDKFVNLREDVLNDMVFFYAESGDFREAHAYFSDISGGAEIYIKALERLSKTYDSQGRYKLALSVNNTLIQEYGESRPELTYSFLTHNVELYRKLGNGVGEENALKRMVDFFVRHGEDIQDKLRETDPQEADLAFQKAKSFLRKRATEMHKQAQSGKSGSKALFSRAADLYGLYLQAFLLKPKNAKDKTEASEIHTYRADALLAAGRNEEALTDLEITLREEGDMKRRKEAGGTLLNILLKKIDSFGGKKIPEALETRFLKIADLFEELFPQDALTSELRYKRARLMAIQSDEKGMPKSARNALLELVEKYPGKKESVEAAQDVFNDAVKRKDESDIEDYGKQFLENGPLMAADKKGELRHLIRTYFNRQSFENVQAMEKDQNFEKAAKEYERLGANSSASNEVSFKAYNNAAVSYEKAGKTSDAIRIYELLMHKYPKQAKPREELRRLASKALWESRFAEASVLYERLSQNSAYSKDERISFAKTAFVLDWGIHELAPAAQVSAQALEGVCASYTSSVCHQMALDRAQVLKEMGRNQEALNQLRGYLQKAGPGASTAEAHFMMAELYKQFDEDQKSEAEYERASQAVARKPREKNFAAHALFLLVEGDFKKFVSIKLELPEDTLKRRTKDKIQLLERLVARYQRVVSFGDGEWGLAALERLSDAFGSFSNELESAPIPPSLSGQNLNSYRQQIRSISQPLAGKALEYLTQGMRTGSKQQVATPTFIALTQRLALKKPKDFPPAHYSLATKEDNGLLSSLRLLGPNKDLSDSWRNEIASKLMTNPKSADVWVEFGNIEALAGRMRIARLLYEQAVALQPKNASALNNLAVILFVEKRPMESIEAFEAAGKVLEFNREIKLNLAKTLLTYHHFDSAQKALKPLVARYSEDNEVIECAAVTDLGLGHFRNASLKMERLEARGSKRFSLWYNWSVWAILDGSKDNREDAVDLLKDRKGDLPALEKVQADVAISIATGREAN